MDEEHSENTKPLEEDSSQELKVNNESHSQPTIIEKKCWNCRSTLQNAEWCDVCRAPINEDIKTDVLSRTSSDESIKCWRCKGTTSGDVCGICGSPLTSKGIKQIKDSILQPETEKEKELDFLLLLSPKDRQIVRLEMKYSQLEAIIKKYFTIIRSGITNYGPEVIIQRPQKTELYDDFEKEEIFKDKNIRILFRKIRISSDDFDLVAIRFFYWKPVDTSHRFNMKKNLWRIFLLLISFASIIITGWLYYKEVYVMLSLNEGLLVDAFVFSFTLLFLIVIHELGHLVIQKIKKITLSLPLFLPIPPIPGFMSYFMLGTAGGFIRVINPIRKRNDLFDSYFFGPIFGLTASIVFVLIGMAFPYIEDIGNLSSENYDNIIEFQQYNPVMVIGLFFEWFAKVTKIAPAFNSETQVLIFHPLTYAGLIGCMLNGLNFLPGSILDGGYMFRSLFGETATRSFSFLSALLLLFNYNTWALGVITMFIPLNIYQTPVTNEALSPHWSKYLLEVLALGIAIICIPIPNFLL